MTHRLIGNNRQNINANTVQWCHKGSCCKVVPPMQLHWNAEEELGILQQTL